MTPLFATALGFVLGFAAGLVHFATLRQVTALYLGGGALPRALGLQLLRLALLAGVLVLLARLGAGPLLAGALGVLIARAMVLRRARKEA
jgi:F1F0 ATPase subunit 2